MFPSCSYRVLHDSLSQYHSGLLVCSDIKDDIPVFSNINDIIVFEGLSFLFTCDFVDFTCFVEHHSFQVKERLCRNVSVLNVETLFFF